MIEKLAHAVDMGPRGGSRDVYFGWTFGFPPGEPGGGMTFMAPPSGGGWCICGSTPAGGQITPFDWAS